MRSTEDEERSPNQKEEIKLSKKEQKGVLKRSLTLGKDSEEKRTRDEILKKMHIVKVICENHNVKLGGSSFVTSL